MNRTSYAIGNEAAMAQPQTARPLDDAIEQLTRAQQEIGKLANTLADRLSCVRNQRNKSDKGTVPQEVPSRSELVGRILSEVDSLRYSAALLSTVLDDMEL